MRDLIGRTVGHYRVVEHLGGGGMGVVYRAEDTKLGRTVALKFLPPEWSRDPDARERFLREARAASALEDSRICTIYDIDETEDGRLYIAMAFYEGETLKKRIERGRLPIDEAVDIAVQVAEGLERAHSAGITHRDIKPANLMLTGRNEVVILDFGLAKLAGEHGLTQTGATLGTPHYMSPEQATGTEVGPITDIWSLGVVLHEMITGERPFGGANGDAVVHSILHSKQPGVGDLRPDTPKMLGRIVNKALEKDPSKRYGSAEEVLADLRTLQVVSVETGVRTAAMQPPIGGGGRRIALLAGVVLVVFVLAMTWVLGRKSTQPSDSDQLPRVVVLPFDNLGPPEDDFFADGLTSEIINRLAAVSGLEVISRTSAMRYKDTAKTIPEIGHELDVDYALEGEVRWEREEEGYGRVRITPQLIRVASDAHLWSERYDTVLEDIFAVQSDIAERVISQLQATLLESERHAIEARPTDNMESYQAYLLGAQYLLSYHEESIRLGVEMLDRAVRLDPEFALAYATLAEAHSSLYHFRYDFSPDRLEMAKTSAEKAMELQPGLGEAHRALGWYYSRGFRDYGRALQQFSMAERALPNDAGVLRGLFAVARRKGHWDEALAAVEKWRRVDAGNWYAPYSMSQTLQFVRDFDRAVEESLNAIALAPDEPDVYDQALISYVAWDGSTDRARRVMESAPGPRTPDNWFFLLQLDLYERHPETALARLETAPVDDLSFQWMIMPKSLFECICLSQMGRVQQGENACASAVAFLTDKIEDRPYDDRIYSALGHAHALIGQKEEAIRAGEHAMELVPITRDALDGGDRAIEMAQIYTRVGEVDKALDLIEELLSIPSWLSVGFLEIDPVWDPLRDHPRFQALLEAQD
jgi:non-specific serine/threonine protein kinase